MFTYWDCDYLLPQPCDVAIIGGGFTGMSAALTIKRFRPRWHVVVFESEAMGTMASSRNAGFLCLGSPTELVSNIQNYGVPVVEELLRCKIMGASLLLHYLKKTISIYHKSVGYEIFSTDFPEPDRLNDQLVVLNGMLRAAGGPAQYFTKMQKAPGGWSPAVENPSWVRMAWEGQIHPAAAVARLRLQFQNLGGIISTHHPVTSLEPDSSGVLLHTASGYIRSRQVLVASNAFAAKLLPKLPVEAHRAQVLITNPLGKMPFRGNVHFREGYMYSRDVGQRLLIGGGRFLDFAGEKTDRVGTTDRIQDYLIEQLSTLTGMRSDELPVADRWSGIMGFTPGRLHPIMEIREQGMVAVAAGMNGMGTALGPYMGKKAAEMLIQEREGRAIHLPQLGFFPGSLKSSRVLSKKKSKEEKGLE